MVFTTLRFIKYDSVAVWPLHETLTDTTVVLDKERLVTLDFKKSIYLEGRFFLQTQHINHQVDQKDIFNLSYNPDQEVEKDDDGQRIYNLYLRVTQEGVPAIPLNGSIRPLLRSISFGPSQSDREQGGAK